MYKETVEQINNSLAREEERIAFANYRRDLMNKTDQILDQLELLNLTEITHINKDLKGAIRNLAEECEIATPIPRKTQNAINLVFRCQDIIMGNLEASEDWNEELENE